MVSRFEGVIDDRALQRWLHVPSAPKGAPLDVPLCLSVLEVLMDVVEASVFVVASDGQIAIANARAVSMLERHGELREFLRTCTTDATWTLGPLRGWTRQFAANEQDEAPRHALVVVERSGPTVERLVERVTTEWTLTSRQAAVFRLLLEGRGNKEIAGRLEVTPRTVEVHVTNLLRKAGVESRSSLIAMTWSRGDSQSVLRARR